MFDTETEHYTVNLPSLDDNKDKRDSNYQKLNDKKISFIVDKKRNTNIMSSEYASIDCCPNKLLKYSLIFYGYIPNSNRKNNIKLMHFIKFFHRSLILLCLSMGFYSIEGITSKNHGSNYLTVMVDFVYPFFYLSSLPYFVKSYHFWKLCSIRSFVMTPYAYKYITSFLLFGFILSITVATWQKIVWKEEHLADNVYNIDFFMWFTFYITFIIRIYLLFLGGVVFWITARFHQRQIKIYLINIRNGYYDKYDMMFDTLISIKTDMNYTNEMIQGYLAVLLITVLISLIVLVTGMLFSYIQITIFINNSSDLFIMGAIAMYILFIAAQTTQRFNDINGKLKKYYHKQIAFVNWKTQEVMLFLLYSSKERNGFKLFGVLLDYGTVMRFCVILISSFLSTFGKRFYS